MPADTSFGLALLPLEGPWQAGDITRQAWSYNAPRSDRRDVWRRAVDGAEALGQGTMISTVKKAEDGDALIVRIYEYAGRGETVELQIPDGFSNAQSVNLLERQASPLTFKGAASRSRCSRSSW